MNSLALFGQDYYNISLDTEFDNGAIVKTFVKNDTIDIGLVISENQSLILSHTKTNGLIDTILVNDQALSLNGVVRDANNYYFFGKNRNISNELVFGQYDGIAFTSKQIIIDDANFVFPKAFIKYKGGFLYAYELEMDENPSKIGVRLSRVDLNGDVIWTKELGVENEKNKLYEILVNSTDEIIVATKGSNVPGFGLNVFQPITYKLSSEGVILKQLVNSEPSDMFAQVYIANLNEEGFVTGSRVNRQQDPDIVFNNLYPFPFKLTFRNNSGSISDDMLISIALPEEIEVAQMSSSKDQEFIYLYGRLFNGDSKKSFGWIKKIEKDGTPVWEKIYSHPESNLPDNDQYFLNLIEDENGDLYAIGKTKKPSLDFNLWLIKINENGCLGGESCLDQLVVTNDLIEIEPSNKDFLIYPNPSQQFINISIFNQGISNITIYSNQGHIIKKINNPSKNIIVDNLIPNMYLVVFQYSNGKSIASRVIIE